MISKKTLGLLAGASVASLMIAGGSALAAGSTYYGPYADLVILTDTDFVILDNSPTPFHATGDVINQAKVGPGTADSIGFLVEDGAIIDGALINTSLATISAVDNVAAPLATATALRIDGTVPSVENHGDITAYANSNPAGPQAYAEANAVEYDSQGLTDGVASLWNLGLIDAHAAAVASYASGATVQAEATAVDEYATGNGAGIGSSALTVVTNDGDINAFAHAGAVAFGSYYGSAIATATAFGVDQFARNAETVTGTLANSGDILVQATANAFGFGNHDAYASGYAVGVDQDAVATGSGTSSASVAVDNTGTITVSAKGDASATDGYAEATATATGITQGAYYAEHSSAIVNNSGDIDVTALADADGTSAYAYAYGAGVSQSVSANDSAGSTAQATVVNTSLYSIDVLADAYAYATYDSAYASATAYGVYQSVYNAEDSAAVVDNSGSINVAANAHATGLEGDYQVTAQATAVGVVQYVTATNGALSSAAATVSNAGDIIASAYAEANNSSSEYAYAYAYATGVYQDVDSAQVATALVENTGNIHATAVARADGFTYYAYAYARAAGVSQEVYGNDAAGSVASATVTNEALLSIDAKATASAFNSGSAVATADATGVSQNAGDAQFASALVDNTGSISAISKAFASATYYSDAYADADAYGVYQTVSATDGVGSTANATVYSDGEITATARADAIALRSDSATAYANATGIYQDVYNAQTAAALVENTGDVRATATANADADSYYAYAGARAVGVSQIASASTYSDYGTASAKVTNESLLSIDAVANAYAEASFYASADAYASGVYQNANSAYTASVLVENSGAISAYANADATATYESQAYASARATGIYQVAAATSDDGSTATATVVNSGTIDAWAYADANVTYSDTAYAYATATGVYQNVRSADTATALVTNTADIHAYASANAYADGANVYASGNARGVTQNASAVYAEGSLAQATVTNESLLSIDAIADAYAYGSYEVEASAYATGVFQEVRNGDTSSAIVNNAGSILADAFAKATATDDFANASAYGTGVEQVANASYGLIDSLSQASVFNDGSISGIAQAYASALGTYASASAFGHGLGQFVGDGDFLNAWVDNTGSITGTGLVKVYGDYVEAYAEGTGVYQELSLPTSNLAEAGLYNSGTVSGYAKAEAYGAAAAATAQAGGYVIIGLDEYNTNGVDLALDITNDGTIQGTAVAIASDTVVATAAGIYAEGLTKSGTITNNGVISARAIADGSTGGALAVGIWDPSYKSTVTITNTGLVKAYAEGPYAEAAGIVIETAEGEQPPDDTVADVSAAINPLEPYATITNAGGTIWAGYNSTNAPAPVSAAAIVPEELIPGVERGYAIYTLNAPNQVLINLTGNNAESHADGIAAVEDGYIFGNIQISDDDEIVVSDGKTWFDGIINDEVPYVGSLNIVDDGNLLLLNREYGPSGAYVDTFFMNETGTLGIEVNADFLNHPFVNANDATVDGRLNVVYQADLYDDFFTYEGVVKDVGIGTLYGSFDEVTDNSALLITSQFYDAINDEIDVDVERIAFGDVVGLTKNQQAVGDAIENVYDDLYDGSPEFENLVAHLFTFDDEEYPIQLNSLSGSEYAQYLQSVIWSTSQMNRTITQRMECDGAWAANMQTASIGGQTIQPVADVVAEPAGCFEPGRVSLWADISGSWNKQDGDQNAPGYDEDQYAFMVGADYAFDDSFYMGVAIGYLDSDMDFKWFGNSIDYNGIQFALYGGYDDTENYIRGILSYGSYDGSSHRYVSVEPSNPIDPKGNPDSDVFSFYGELGHRFAMGSETNLTPFAGLSLAQGEIDSFTESDPEGTGAALHISSSDGNSVASLLGVRLGGNWLFGNGFFTPDISVAWMHEFDDERQTVKASFADAPPGADFKVVGSKTARDSAVVNVGGTFGLTEGVDFSVIYDGRYSSDYSASALIGRVGVKF